MPEADMQALVLESPQVQKHLEGRTIRKVIIVPNKLVNIAAS